MDATRVSQAFKRYWAVILFPTFTVVTIFADWNHTRLWKKEVAKQKELERKS